MRSDYTYAIDIYREDGTAVGQAPIDPDWTPALEWTHFEGIRAGQLPPVLAANLANGDSCIDPVWHPTAGQPYVSAFQITVPGNGAGGVSRQIPTAYVRGLVQQTAAAFVEQRRLRTGERFGYLVSAFAASAPSPPGAEHGIAFAVEEVAQPLPLAEAALAPFLHGARHRDVAEADGDLPVFIPEDVLDESMTLAREAGDVETGGVLIGLLHRDPSISEIFVAVTAQIAALHTQAQATKLTFTPDTWAAVRAALRLRQRGEIMVGWWHYHPDFCRLRNCPLENRRRCTASSAFFSGDDVALHTALFGRGYDTALLISDSAATGLTPSLFGWRQGMVTARGFYTTGKDTRDGTSSTTD